MVFERCAHGAQNRRLGDKQPPAQWRNTDGSRIGVFRSSYGGTGFRPRLFSCRRPAIRPHRRHAEFIRGRDGKYIVLGQPQRGNGRYFRRRKSCRRAPIRRALNCNNLYMLPCNNLFAVTRKLPHSACFRSVARHYIRSGVYGGFKWLPEFYK